MISFNTYSFILSILPVGIIFMILLQIVSDFSSKRSDRATTTLLYTVYISSLACACVGFSLHVFESEIWCEKFGMIPCFSMLGGSKAVLYLFFVRRAKLAQGITISRRLKLLLTYIAPGYLFIYWIAYCVLTTFLFSLQYTPHDEHHTVSNCLVGTWAVWFLVLASCIDVFNCSATLALFLWPLLRAMHQANLLTNLDVSSTSPRSCKSKVKDATQIIRLEFISVMKWNVALSSVATMSSVLTLVMITVSNHYIWLFCLGDPFINCICTYGMIASNRRYMSQVLPCTSHSDSGRSKGFSLNDWIQHGGRKQPPVDTDIDTQSPQSGLSDTDAKSSELPTTSATMITMQPTASIGSTGDVIEVQVSVENTTN
eukprot:258636_1